MDLSGLISALMTIGIFIFGGGYLYERFIRGRNSKVEEERKINQDQTRSNTEILGLMQKQIESLKELSKEHTEQLIKHKENAIRMTTQIEEKDKKLQEYVAIFQGRNPQMEAFMVAASKYMEVTSVTILNLQKWLDSGSKTS